MHADKTVKSSGMAMMTLKNGMYSGSLTIKSVTNFTMVSPSLNRELQTAYP